jgi:hypothetical protein
MAVINVSLLITLGFGFLNNVDDLCHGSQNRLNDEVHLE